LLIYIKEKRDKFLNSKQKSYRPAILIILIVLVLAPTLWILFTRMEGQAPVVNLSLDKAALGRSQTLTLTISDEKSGIRRVWIGVLKDGKEVDILKKSYPSAGFFTGGISLTDTIDVPIEPAELGLTDGKAILRLAVWDYSWRKWGKGNQAYLEKEVVIDTQPPKIDIYTTVHNLNQGGAGLIIYRLSETCRDSGVSVGDDFYPGQTGVVDDKNVYLCFFALNPEQGPGTQLVLKAVDEAGNTSEVGFNHHINARKFKHDTIAISDQFINWKMPEFSADFPDITSASAVDQFLMVNRKLRQRNRARIHEITRRSDAQIHWKGPFLRLPNAANRAGFADHRTYKYKGKEIDRQMHLGIDLASVAHSAVPAANDGRVAFAERLGIYGNAVVIDHGFGLFSLYGHLSNIDVTVDQMVAKGDIIGKTGRSGLAGGDHLHFAMLVHGTYVNPLEWWDASWIENKITSKLIAVHAQ
jgi:murein DD-endopeptidase MepM/ murein hydrolase activator NlpD